jgi:DNA-binding transcriptional LysR family regulator
MDRLKALAVFKAVVDHRGFSRAADALYLSRAAVTRMVQDLETQLGVRLLARSTRSISLTSVGQDVLAHAARLLSSYDELASLGKLSASEPMGTVRLLAPAAYARHYLGPALSDFMQRHPKVEIDLVLREGPLSLIAKGFDVALCTEADLRDTLIARRLADTPVSMFAAPCYVARRGAPSHPSELLSHDCLGAGPIESTGRWSLQSINTGEDCVISVNGGLRCDHLDMLVAAAVHGAGVVLVPDFLVKAELERGDLVRLLPGWAGPPNAVYLAYESRRNQPMSARKLVDHLSYWLGGEEEAHDLNARHGAHQAGNPVPTLARIFHQGVGQPPGVGCQ